MSRPPRRLQGAALAIAAGALLALAGAWSRGTVHMRPASWLMAGEIGAALIIAQLVPIPLARRTQFWVGTTAFLLATLLLPLPVAMAGVGLISIGTDMTRRVSWTANRRVPWYDTAINTGERILRVGVGALVFQAVANTPILASTVTPRLLGATVLTGIAMCAANIGVVYLMISVQAGKFQARAILRMLRLGMPQEGSLLLLGVLGAMIAAPAPALIALPLAATILIYRELTLQRSAPVEVIDEREDEQQAAGAAFPVIPSVATYLFGVG